MPPEKKLPRGGKEKSLIGHPLTRATQGNFDHLMSTIREVANAHNVVVDDLEAIIDALNGNVDATESLTSTIADLDHGGLTGLGDDDHPQYAALAQNETVSGAWTFTGNVTHANATTIYFKDSGGTPRQAIHWSAGNLFQVGSTFASLSLFGDINFAVDGTTRAYMDGNGQLTLDLANSGASRGLAFGGSEDVNLYRAAANTLQTDDYAIVGGGLNTNANLLTPALDVYGAVVRIGDAISGQTFSQGLGIKFHDSGIAHASFKFTPVSNLFSWGDSSGDGNALALSVTAMTLGTTSGQLSLPVTGSGAGIVIGGDVHLYRSAADIATSPDAFVAEKWTGTGAIGGVGIEARTSGVSGSALQIIGTTGSRLWVLIPAATGTGLEAGAGGLSLYDGTAGLERVAFTTSGSVNIVADAGQLLFGGSQDTNLYRGSAGILATDSKFHVIANEFAIDGVNPYIQAANAASNSLALISGTKFMWVDSTKDGLLFGTAKDTNLYRDSASVLKTDDQLWVVGGVLVSSPSNGYEGELAVGTSTFLSSRITTDSQYRFLVDASGKMLWGSGSAGGDTNLYRSAANTLKTDDGLDVLGPLRGVTIRAYGPGSQMAVFDNDFATDEAFLVGVSGDDFDRFAIYADGKHEWGGGTLARDTSLYRAAANHLLTPDLFQVAVGSAGSPQDVAVFSQTGGYAGAAFVNSGNDVHLVIRWTGDGVERARLGLDGSANGALMFAGASGTADTNLYRGAADRLSTDDSLYAGLYLKAFQGSDQEMLIGSVVAGLPGILFGDDQDTNLYRSAANTLKTDDNVYVTLNLHLEGGADPAFSISHVNTFRIQNTGVFVWGNDTNLYRDSANVLKTDDGFVVGGVAGFTATAGPVTLGTVTANDIRTPFVQSPDATGPYADLQNATNSVLLINRDSAAYIPLSVQGMAAQTGHLTNWLNNSAQVVAYMSAGGGLHLFPGGIESNAFSINAIGAANPRFYFDEAGTQNWGPGGGTAVDTNLYRLAASYLKTDDTFIAGLEIYAGHSQTWQVVIGRTGPSDEPGIILGNSLDAKLYREVTIAGNTALHTENQVRAPSGFWGPNYYTSDNWHVQNYFYNSSLNNAFTNADKWGTITYTGDWATTSAEALFNDNVDDTSNSILSGDTATVELDGSAHWPGSGITYTQGFIYVTFYYVYNPTDISGRMWYDIPGTPAWISLGTPVNVAAASNVRVYRFTVPATNYATKFEFTIDNSLGPDTVYPVAIEYMSQRPAGQHSKNYIRTEQADETFGNLTWKTSAGARTFRVQTDGTLVWGSGGDVNLYRSGANILFTDDAFSATGIITSSASVRVHTGAASTDAFLSTVTGDVNYRFIVDTDGTHHWGDGTSSIDTDLYRYSAGILATGSRIHVERPLSADLSFSTLPTGAANARFYIDATGTLAWGSGAGAADTNLYRSSANNLYTDDTFTSALGFYTPQYVAADNYLQSGGSIYLVGTIQTLDATGAYLDFTSSGNGIYLTNRTDASYVPFIVRGMAAQSGDLQRWESSTPTTLAYVNAAGSIWVAAAGGVHGKAGTSGSTQAFTTFVTGDSDERWMTYVDGKMEWGTGAGARDTNLYRSAANQLKTDDSFLVAGTHYANTWESYSGAVLLIKGPDAGGTDVLEIRQTSGNTLIGKFIVGGQLQLPVSGSGAGLLLGGDANLYRASADVLRTSDSLVVDGTLTVSTSSDLVDSDTVWDAVGDLVVGSGANTAARLPKGTNGQMLYVDTGEALDLKWDDPPGAGPGSTPIEDRTMVARRGDTGTNAMLQNMWDLEQDPAVEATDLTSGSIALGFESHADDDANSVIVDDPVFIKSTSTADPDYWGTTHAANSVLELDDGIYHWSVVLYVSGSHTADPEDSMEFYIDYAEDVTLLSAFAQAVGAVGPSTISPERKAVGNVNDYTRWEFNGQLIVPTGGALYTCVAQPNFVDAANVFIYKYFFQIARSA